MNTPQAQKWTVEECNEEGIFNGSYFVTCPDEHWPNDHDERNVVCRLPTGRNGKYLEHARLIAAAPELLAEVQRLDAALFTLKMAFGHLSPGLKDALVHHYTKARNVISRATGKE